jgi:cysteine-rich repeat protein
MKRTTRTHLGLALLAMASATPRLAGAERLFARAEGLPSSAPGIARVQTLGLDAAALASLRQRDTATFTDFPLGGDATVTVSLTRIEPFTGGARAVVMEADGPHDLALPDNRYYRGTVDGDPGSLVVLVAGTDTARGYVSTGGTTYRFGRDRTGVHRSWALRDADASAFPAPDAFCGNDGAAALVTGHPGRTGTSAPVVLGDPPVAAFSPTLLAQVALDTDNEFLALFGTNDEALDYLADLSADISAIYDTDTNVRIKFSFIRLWNVPDPWTSASTTTDILDEFKAYWTANEGSTPRDIAHLLSGKTGNKGGLAYLDVLCDPTFGYGVSKVYGEYDLMNPSDIWDVEVVSHEMGHNFGSVHTHCYMPPVDNCYNQEPGCYAGPTSLPGGGGTIMSYCHLLSGGLANINLTFGATVSAVLRTGAENGICIGPPCGDGFLDPGEDCDDNNNDNGDCCSSTCTAEPDGGSCDDGEACTGTDQCSSGVCVGTPVVDGSPCDDGSQCTDDSCQSGACVGVPAPAVGCKVPTLPLKSQLILKDKTPDKGDQVVWKWTKGADTSLAELGDPTTSDDYQLCVYGPGPSLLFSGRVPAGGVCHGFPCWKTIIGKGYTYKDKDRTPDGMEKLQLTSGIAGAAKISAKGKGDNLVMPVLGSLATPIEAQLRGAGLCWSATYSTPIVNTTAQFKAKSD